MQQWRTTRPAADEHSPYYANYIAQVPDGDLLATLERQMTESLGTWRGVSPAKAEFRYAEGKWSLKEVLLHIIDAERVFSYRALRAARNDETALPGFDENLYAKASRANERQVADLANEFEHLRRANLALFASFDDDMAARRVTASGNIISARALMWIIAGHERHHGRVLKERYLSG